jgi:hypothetical protein
MTDDIVKVDVPKSTKCYHCSNNAEHLTFYLTEWCIMTGASTDGLYYCEDCINKYLRLING